MWLSPWMDVSRSQSTVYRTKTARVATVRITRTYRTLSDGSEDPQNTVSAEPFRSLYRNRFQVEAQSKEAGRRKSTLYKRTCYRTHTKISVLAGGIFKQADQSMNATSPSNNNLKKKKRQSQPQCKNTHLNPPGTNIVHSAGLRLIIQTSPHFLPLSASSRNEPGSLPSCDHAFPQP
jgi:hypothetical protein